jgi:hypothetical protein
MRAVVQQALRPFLNRVEARSRQDPYSKRKGVCSCFLYRIKVHTVRVPMTSALTISTSHALQQHHRHGEPLRARTMLHWNVEQLDNKVLTLTHCFE